ncbi:MAG: PorT family protein [Candidatus Eisenbacteria bacterium]|uniref:PorT family protein n=1 Tax=Eiseniibacteriota bacterium TaxID=2212470 RepID=A0A849SL23_UNCEI|nr:PorT family protein [Candidatus Eisenbacteria bacterium]
MKLRSAFLSVVFVAAAAVPASAAGFTGGVNAGFGMPIGDLSDVASTGFNLGLFGEQMMNDHIAIGGEIGLQSYGGNDDFEKDLSSLASENVDFTLRAVPVLAYGKFVLGAQGTALPFLRAGLGLYHLTGKTEGETFDADDSETKFGLNFGGGAAFKVNDSLTWGIDGLYHYILGAASDGSGDESAGSIVTVRGSLAFAFTK